MFYSHEILTNRKYGVATVWLVATLGAKSNTRKVTRKAILDVNVQKACETIMEPEAPMALRLQSNLLYGVSRVYSQQVGYVLADAQTAQATMRALFKIARNNEIDLQAGKGDPDQLILMDDPAFLPDMALPPLEWDLSQIDFTPTGDSQASLMTPRSRRRNSTPSARSVSMPSLNLPSSSNGGPGSHQLPFNNLFGDMSALKTPSRKGGLFEQEEMMAFDDNLDFGIDADGNFHDITEADRQSRRVSSLPRLGRLGSDSAASGRVRIEHEEEFAGNIDPFDDQGDFNMMQFGDDALVLPDAPAFPLMSGANPDASQRDPAEEPFSDPLVSSESAAAPLKRRRKPKKANKKSLIDGPLYNKNSVLDAWQKGYLQNMKEAIEAKQHRQSVARSKVLAKHYVWGTGIGHVGDVMGSSLIQGPLAAMFSGEALMERLIGKQIKIPKKAKKSAKRPHSPDSADEADNEPRRVRSRQQEDDEIGRGMNLEDGEDLIIMGDDSVSVEIAREAESALPDIPSSAMPWNVSASVHSHQHGHSQASSSIRGPGSYIPSSLNRRLTAAASPLVGRGSKLPGELENFSQNDHDIPILYGREDEDDDEILRGQARRISESQAVNDEEFELYGAAANVDTQEASKSQWVRAALDAESENFFEYVRNTIAEQEKNEQEKDDEENRAFVTFEELFHPESHSHVVAAQAFYHVLTLATKGRVWTLQEEEVGGFGEIRIGVCGLRE